MSWRRLRALGALLVVGAGPALALDLVHARRVLTEMRFVRTGPRPQTLTFRSASEPGGDWPARFAQAEHDRRRRGDRHPHTWSGFLGGVPVWGVDGEVLRGPREARRIRRRLELWADAPGGFRMHAVAEDPGGRGRRLLERRVGRILRDLRRFQRRQLRDPFAGIRSDADGGRWTEMYRVRLPSKSWLELHGPAPAALPPLPTVPDDQPLLGEFPQERTEPGAPEAFRRALVPGYLVRYGPDELAPREARWLRAVLGIEAGVEATASQGVALPPAPPPATDDLAVDLDFDLEDF